MQAGDKFPGFSLGDAKFTPLKTFVRRHAAHYENSNLSRTYVVDLNDKQIAYVTIVCGEVVVEDGGPKIIPDAIKYTYNSYPALKIARLAVDSKHRGLDLGTRLVQFALGVAKRQICPWAGCRFVMVDSKKESLQFYEKCGFTLLDTKENRIREEPVLFIDLLKSSDVSVTAANTPTTPETSAA